MAIKFTKTIPSYRKFDSADPKRTRRPYDQVLGYPTGASPRGSTYWKRVHRCPRELALYEGGLRRIDPFSDAIIVGLLYHLALEHYYKALKDGQLGFAEHLAWQAIAPFSREPGYHECYEHIERMLTAYFELYRDIDSKQWRVLAVEEVVEYNDEGRLEWSGRFDLIVEKLSTGMIWGVEHKSTKFITPDLLSGYQMDLQIPGYSWLFKKVIDIAALGGKPFVGFIVNIATRETRPSLERVEVVPSKQHLAEFEMSMQAALQMRNRGFELGSPKVYGNCIGAPRYFSRCDYFDVCYSQPELSVAQLLAAEAPFGFVNTNLTGPVSSVDPDEAA